MSDIIQKTNYGNESIFKLEKQLHEQYAINNNSNSGILISLISALLMSFSGYGYVLYQYCTGNCNIDIVNLAAIMVMAVMVLLYCISVHLGSGQRMEQFITIAIRKKYYSTDTYKEIFPDGYHPFNKSYCSFVQGIYNIWSKATLLVILGIISYHLVITLNPCPVVICGVVCVVFCVMYRLYKYKKYKDREQSLIGSFTCFVHDVRDDRKYFSYCNVICCVVVITFTVLSLWFIITTGLGCKIREGEMSKPDHILNVVLNDHEVVQVQITH